LLWTFAPWRFRSVEVDERKTRNAGVRIHPRL
jgi:hypothetical protein